MIDSPVARSGEQTHYKIVVRGTIPDNWLDRLGNMKVENEFIRRSGEVSVLRGSVRDQAELHGVLESLYRLQAALISVEQIRG